MTFLAGLEQDWEARAFPQWHFKPHFCPISLISKNKLCSKWNGFDLVLSQVLWDWSLDFSSSLIPSTFRSLWFCNSFAFKFCCLHPPPPRQSSLGTISLYKPLHHFSGCLWSFVIGVRLFWMYNILSYTAIFQANRLGSRQVLRHQTWLWSDANHAPKRPGFIIC